MVDRDLVLSLFPSDLPDPEHWEKKFPQRDLAPGALVTRFGPSPTGYLHIGGVFTGIVAQDLARASKGSYFIRIEDTDIVREIAEARAQFSKAFKYFGIESDESDENAQWGPYEQSKRELIYHTHARKLLSDGHAYPCFCTKEELDALATRQQAAKITTGYYGQWATCRNLQPSDVHHRIKSGQSYTIRFRSPDGPPGRIAYHDLIRGTIEQDDNRNDIVLLKSSTQSPRLPTYHFAHAVDDHLMRVNLILRGDEWISSVPLHLQLFAALGFDALPYAHFAPLMKIEGKSKRKLSKRKDKEANVEFYIASGYPAGAVRHYLRGLANSNLADLGFAQALSVPITLERCGVAGPMFDLQKLEAVSRDYIAETPHVERIAALTAWAQSYDPELTAALNDEAGIAPKIFAMESIVETNVRKDLAKWSDFKSAYGYFYRRLYRPVNNFNDQSFAPLDPDTVSTLAADFCKSYAGAKDRDEWFGQIRSLANRHGFASSVSEYKASPSNYKGSVRDVSNAVRVLLTGLTRSHDLFVVASVIGEQEVLRRAGSAA